MGMYFSSAEDSHIFRNAAHVKRFYEILNNFLLMALHLSGLIGLLALIGLIIGVHVTISLNRGSLNLQPKHVFIYVLY